MDSVLKTFDEKLRAARSVAIFAHKNPDGDALCSVLALARLIEMNYGRRPLCVYDGNIPDALDNVPDRNRIQFYSRIDMARPFDVAIVLDYGTARNIGGPMPVLENAKYTIEIDHHIKDEALIDQHRIIQKQLETITHLKNELIRCRQKLDAIEVLLKS